MTDQLHIAGTTVAAPTKTKRPACDWYAVSIQAGVDLATALLRFPAEGNPKRLVNLPAYPCGKLYSAALQKAWWYSTVHGEPFRSRYTIDDDDDDLVDLDERAEHTLDWSDALLGSIIAAFGWEPWIRFRDLSFGYFTYDLEGCARYLDAEAAGPYRFPAYTHHALRVVRKRLRHILQTLDDSGADVEAAGPQLVLRADGFKPEPTRTPPTFVIIPPEGLPLRTDGKLVLHKVDAVNSMFKPVAPADVPPDAIVLPASTPKRRITYAAWVEAGGRTS